MTWVAPPLSFYAFLDANGTVKQLDINAGSLSDAQTAALPCSATRTRRSMLLAAKQVPVHPPLPACQLVSAAEMSAILGEPVSASSADRPPASTRCTYKPASGVSPQVGLTFNWGDGAAAMSGLGLAGKREPGVVTPFEGVGDQAGVAGPALMIRAGDHLVTMVFTGVAGTPAKAKKIFGTTKESKDVIRDSVVTARVARKQSRRFFPRGESFAVAAPRISMTGKCHSLQTTPNNIQPAEQCRRNIPTSASRPRVQWLSAAYIGAEFAIPIRADRFSSQA